MIRPAKLRKMVLLAKLAALVAVEAAAFAIVSPVAWLLGGHMGLLAAGIAAASCLAGGILALVICGLFRDPAQAYAGVILGMVTGMGLPLAVGIVCQASGGDLSRAGVMFYLLYFFPITLAVKTALSLSNMSPRVPLEKGRAN